MQVQIFSVLPIFYFPSVQLVAPHKATAKSGIVQRMQLLLIAIKYLKYLCGLESVMPHFGDSK